MKTIVYKLVIDNFAGGGGASTGIEQAIGRSVDVAINHDQDAIAMHTANHPNTKHYCEDVFDIDPLEVTKGRPVALCWLSPDCKHFSKAKGSTPVSKKIRGLAWIGVRWGLLATPDVMCLENVEEFKTWGPLIFDKEKEGYRPDPKKKGLTFNSFKKILSTGISRDDEGYQECLETLEIEEHSFYAERIRKGLGYQVEFKELRACDYGAPTTRKRLFMIARRDGQKIVWPKPTHGPRDSQEVKMKMLEPYRSAAEIIDWSIPGTSIFGRKKPLSENTLKRIGRGLRKFVIESADPFIVRIGQTGFGGDKLQYPLSEPLTTITTKAEHCLITPYISVNTSNHSGSDISEPVKTITTGGHHMFVAPQLVQMGYGDGKGQKPRIINIENPVGTITSGGNKFALAMPFLSKYYGGNYSGSGIDMREPTDTITAVDHHAIAAAWIKEDYGCSTGTDIKKPLGTVTAQSNHHSLMTAFISKTYGGQSRSIASDIKDCVHTITARNVHSLVNVAISENEPPKDEVQDFLRKYCDNRPILGERVKDEDSAFLIKYYGSDTGQPIDEPIHTIPTKDRFGLIRIKGVEYQIVDITLRMLQPRELFNAMGFPDCYEIDRDHNNKKISKAKQVARCGNAVSPPIPKALVEKNLPELCLPGPFREQQELLNADFGW